MNDFLDTFPPPTDHPVIEDAANALVKWAKQTEAWINFIRLGKQGDKSDNGLEIVYKNEKAIAKL